MSYPLEEASVPRFLVEINQNAAEATVERCPPHAVSAYSFCAGADIDCAIFVGAAQALLSLKGGVTPEIIRICNLWSRFEGALCFCSGPRLYGRRRSVVQPQRQAAG